MESVVSALGAGSGIDITALVNSLAAASRRPKDELLTRRATINQARLQALSDIASGISGFSSALAARISGGNLATQPTSSDAGLITVSLNSGARINAIASTIIVNQLAKSQTLQSVGLASSQAVVGQGTLALTTSKGSFNIVVGAQSDSVSGLAAAINAANAGVVASVISDSQGARLILRGESGAANTFTLTLTSGLATELGRFAYPTAAGNGLSLAQAAQDAAISVDGVSVTGASNSFANLIEGVTINLKRADPGVSVAIGSARPTVQIEQAVGDFVEAYNQLMGQISEAGRNGAGAGAGPLRGDIGLNDLRARLLRLSDTALTSSGNGPHRLAQIGVRTNRDGTIGFDRVIFASVIATNPQGVEAMFRPGQFSDNSLVTINSDPSRVRPGQYTISDIVPASGGQPASGRINGIAMTGIENQLVAPAGSAAPGLILSVADGATTAVVTIEPGLGGALAAISEAVRIGGGGFAASRARLQLEAREITSAREIHESRSTRNREQLLTSYVAMDRRVAAFRATQSYLTQQIAVWNNNAR